MPVEAVHNPSPIGRTTPRADLPEFLTIKETADFLGVSTWTVRANIHQGHIPHKRIGPKIILIPKGYFSEVTP